MIGFVLVWNSLNGEGLDMSFIVNGYALSLLLSTKNGIYPKWFIFVQTIYALQDEKWQHYAKTLEVVKKDVERWFSMLQARVSIIQYPSQEWHLDSINDIIMACVI